MGAKKEVEISKKNEVAEDVVKGNPKLSTSDKILRTAFAYLAFFGLGLTCSITGPTLEDLASGINIDIKKFTLIYTARSGGGIVGCLLAGVLLSKFNRYVVLGIVTIICAIDTTVIPWCPTMETVIVAMVIYGVCIGLTETSCNVICMAIWEGNCGPYMQALHFCFGVGGFAAPLIAEPFLKPMTRHHHLDDDLYRNESIVTASDFNSNESYTTFASDFEPYGTVASEINDTLPVTKATLLEGYYTEYSFGIIGAYLLAVFLFFLIICVKNVTDHKRKSKDRTDIPQHSKLYKYVIVTLTVLYFIVLTGMQIGFAQLIATYAVECDLKLSKSTGSYLTSVYWGSFTVSRCISILLAVKISGLALIITEHVMWAVSGVVLVIFGNNTELFLWIGVALFGFGLGPLFAAVCSWLEHEIYISSVICSFFVICCSIGEMLFPFLLGQLIVAVPVSMMYIVLITSVVSVVVFCITWTITIARKKSCLCFDEMDKKDNESIEYVSRF